DLIGGCPTRTSAHRPAAYHPTGERDHFALSKNPHSGECRSGGCFHFDRSWHLRLLQRILLRQLWISWWIFCLLRIRPRDSFLISTPSPLDSVSTLATHTHLGFATSYSFLYQNFS